MSGYRFDRLNVLLVDDSTHMRKLVGTILTAFGVRQLHEAPNAEKAWAMIREVNPDMIIMDWMMEGMNGIELAQLIRTSKQSPNPFVPIIMLSGYSHAGRVREARDAGINEFLAKPVSANAILTHITSVIENPRPFVRTKTYFGPDRRRVIDRDYKGVERRSDIVDAAATA